MINVVLDNGYFTGMACKVGKFENGIDVETLPNEVDPVKQRAYKLENNSWVFDENKYQELLIEENERKQNALNLVRISEIQTRLNELSQDFVQVNLGAVFDDLEQRKAEFKSLHNELRGLLGKEPREYKS